MVGGARGVGFTSLHSSRAWSSIFRSQQCRRPSVGPSAPGSPLWCPQCHTGPSRRGQGASGPRHRSSRCTNCGVKWLSSVCRTASTGASRPGMQLLGVCGIRSIAPLICPPQKYFLYPCDNCWTCTVLPGWLANRVRAVAFSGPSRPSRTWGAAMASTVPYRAVTAWARGLRSNSRLRRGAPYGPVAV